MVYNSNPLPADSFSKYKTKVIPIKVCIMRLYTIINTVYFESIDSSSAAIYKISCIYLENSSEDESIDSKYTVFNCVKSHHAHFIRNYSNLKR